MPIFQAGYEHSHFFVRIESDATSQELEPIIEQGYRFFQDGRRFLPLMLKCRKPKLTGRRAKISD